MTHYEVLRVAPGASAEEIHAAYKKLAIQHHPDRGGDAEKFKCLTEAKAVLLDPAARARYDAEHKLLEADTDCERCEGKGRVFKSRGFTGRVEIDCPECGGTGRIYNST